MAIIPKRSRFSALEATVRTANALYHSSQLPDSAADEGRKFLSRLFLSTSRHANKINAVNAHDTGYEIYRQSSVRLIKLNTVKIQIILTPHTPTTETIIGKNETPMPRKPPTNTSISPLKK